MHIFWYIKLNVSLLHVSISIVRHICWDVLQICDNKFMFSFTSAYTTCRNEYQNGVFTYTLPSRFHLVRQDPPLTPIMTPSLSPILPPPYSPRTESPPKQDNDWYVIQNRKWRQRRYRWDSNSRTRKQICLCSKYLWLQQCVELTNEIPTGYKCDTSYGTLVRTSCYL